MRRALILLLLIFLAACATKKTIELEPFIGGNDGLKASFADFRKNVFDGGKDPFDIIVRLDNLGESQIKKEDVEIRIDGINPLAFGKSEEQLTKNSPEDIRAVERAKEAILTSPPIFTEFNGLNHLTAITGSKLSYPIIARICYSYKTKSQSKFCIRRNILNPEEGPCKIEETKQTYNSGAPVHVENVKETARGTDKIGISFDIKHVGKGTPYDRASKCPDSEKPRNKVFVKIDTNMPGLSCTGMTTTSAGTAEGTVQLFDGIKTMTCTQTVSKGDFEQPLNILLEYEYEDRTQTELIVKHVGDQTAQEAPQAE
ncbi:hypothetical protein HY486_02900 [Candidatus Woesearchaeota archaeon]|nr:hypothetical protein [Candidatus Woesearchaeota archaeon]